jgi:cob(I)alamin adenosyltransferase
MSITTKKGDFGASLSPHGQLPKNHPFFEVVGDLDEAQAALAHVVQLLDGLSLNDDKQVLSQALVQLSYIAGDTYRLQAIQFRVLEQTALLERRMSELEMLLPPLRGFILPTGHKAATAAHLARAIVRRAERHYVALIQDPRFPLEATPYLNRLSDYLFLVARWINHTYAIEDVLR